MAKKDSTKTNPITSFSQLSCGKLKGEDKKQCEKDRKAFAKRAAKEFGKSIISGPIAAYPKKGKKEEGTREK
tara:strand:+ start:245 stop:460 length:216 start_codon:yes stop_codon:yes gene_type:complete